tara:strand:- start:58660 stop:59313 length:654 start_codon:yes stop_codon:yes gene_type:complete
MRSLSYKDDRDIICICAIDPGTDTMGYSIILLNLKDLTITIDRSETFVASKALRHYPEVDRSTRLKWLEKKLATEFKVDQPDLIIMESAFAKRRMISAFEALIECKQIINNAVAEYNESMTVILIDPISVKYGIGALKKGKKVPKVKGKKVDTKDLVRKVIEEDKDLKWNGLDVNLLDQHSVDAIAVGLWLANNITTTHLDYLQTIKSLQGALKDAR